MEIRKSAAPSAVRLDPETVLKVKEINAARKEKSQVSLTVPNMIAQIVNEAHEAELGK